MRILLVEDEPDLAAPLLELLRRERYEVVWAPTADAAYEILAARDVDLAVLDVMLPEGEDAGFELARHLRDARFPGQVLFLTARDSIEDRVRGLDAGGDDYLVKPFSLQEFLARVRALLRRFSGTRSAALERGSLRVEFATRRVYWKEREVTLSEREFAMIEHFAHHPDRVFSVHELRTPLSALRTQVERAQLGLAPAVEVLPVLARNVARMEGILGALLALARSSERDPTPLPLRSLVRETVRALPPRQAARVSVADGTTVPVEVTDARLVQQALQNLVDNALRHTAGPVTIRVDAREGWVELRVRDRGPGLPEEVLQGPRKPFARHGHDRGGLGLGLSLVDRIAQALRGELVLRNRPDGLEARLRLPVRADGVPSPTPSRGDDGAGSTEPGPASSRAAAAAADAGSPGGPAGERAPPEGDGRAERA